MKLNHLLLTRFSYRQNPEDHDKQVADVFIRNDPLNPDCLDFRFALFESACLPNVMAQTNQNFDWVLIIDPDLPLKYRQRLEKLVANRERTHLHEFQRDDLGRLEWLEKYIPSDSDWVLTSNLDDDDIITIDFVEKIQLHVKELGATAPSIKLLGMKTTYQWDLYISNKHPFGTWAPWHRSNFFRSTGLSMLCKTSAHRLTVYQVAHNIADIWYSPGNKQQVEEFAREMWGLSKSEPCFPHYSKISKLHRILEETSDASGDDWKSLPSTELHYDLSKDGLIAVHLNHFINDQATRLFEQKPETVPVVDTQFFPDEIRIDWSAFKEHRKLFELSSQRYEKLSSELNAARNKLSLVWWKSFLLLIIMRTKLKWFFLRN